MQHFVFWSHEIGVSGREAMNATMSSCFSSISVIPPSPLIHDSHSPSLPIRLRSTPALILRTNAGTSSGLVRVLQQRVGVVSPDDLSPPEPVIDVKEEEVFGGIDGVAGTKAEEKTIKAPNRVKRKGGDGIEESDDNRFKLRNGREVHFLYCFSRREFRFPWLK